MTGYGQPQDRVFSSAAGFDHHFVKPADQQELLLLLSNLAVQIKGNFIN
jgi:CheY-like chemotaxis protein